MELARGETVELRGVLPRGEAEVERAVERALLRPKASACESEFKAPCVTQAQGQAGVVSREEMFFARLCVASSRAQEEIRELRRRSDV